MDETAMRIGDPLAENIRAAIHAVEYVVLLCSHNSLESEWVRRELEISLNYEREKGCVKLLPILIDSCELPAPLQNRVYARLSALSELENVVALIETRLQP